jgi:ribosomal protein S19E (S16A)
MSEYIDEELKTVEVKTKIKDEKTGKEEEKVIESKDFYISKFPAVLGREIMMRYSVSMAKIDKDYAENEEILRKMMKFVRVELPDGRKIALDSETLINNHVPSGEMLQALENAVLAHNFSFFRDGNPLN